MAIFSYFHIFIYRHIFSVYNTYKITYHLLATLYYYILATFASTDL